MLLNKLQTLTGRSISIIADGLTRPVGGTLADVGGDFIVIMPQDGMERETIIPINRIVSILIMHMDGGKHGNHRKDTVQQSG